MTDIVAMLRSDYREILARISHWAADPDGATASTRYLAIIDSMTFHARFTDMAVSTLITPFRTPSTVLAHRLVEVHHSVISLLESLSQALHHGQTWAMHLGVLIDVVCPHLAIHDNLIISILRQTLAATALEEMGNIFNEVREEFASSARKARSGRLMTTIYEVAEQPPQRQQGHYPGHHPDAEAPWRMLPSRLRPELRPGPGSPPPRARTRRRVALMRK